MSQAAYLRDMMTEPALDLAAGSSEVTSFYAGRNVLLTGGTGFLGRLLIERIMRSCPEVNTMFLLAREKKGKSSEERFTELFNDVVFDRLRRERPGFARKVVLVNGDMMQGDLGLSPEQRKLLQSTHIVVHCAATVRFDAKLRIAANINVRGTLELLSLAREMVDLKAFVHVSTAYSQCVSHVIEEQFYPPPIDSDKLLSLIDLLDDASLDHLTPVLLGRWPNTYAFTKAVAEDTIRRNCQGLPVCIVRPSIVIATSKEPVSGWINNVYGVTGVLVGVAVGLLRTLHSNDELVADLIPADYVVNSIIVAAWATAETQSLKVNGSTVPSVESPPTIYNAVTSSQAPITWGQLHEYTLKYAVSIPSVRCIWHYYFISTKYRWVYNLTIIFLHLVPAAMVDSLAWLTGRKPMLWAAYKKIHKFSSVIEYFAMREWRFDNKNFQQLWNRLGPADRSEFDLDVGRIDWDEYNYHHVRGIRLYLLKDPFDTLPQARVRYAKLKVAHYTLITALCGILLWLLWMVCRLIGLW